MPEKTNYQLLREEKRILVTETCRDLFNLSERTHPNENIVFWISLTKNALRTYFPECVPPLLDSVMSQIIMEFYCGR